MSDAEALGFDELLTRLEAVVARLEREDLPLEEAMAAYEQGIGWVRQGHARLASVERRIEELTERGEVIPSNVEEES